MMYGSGRFGDAVRCRFSCLFRAGPGGGPDRRRDSIMNDHSTVARSAGAENWPWRTSLAVAGLMVLLALVGVGLTTTDRAIAPKYWLCLVPVYGLLCIGTAWANGSRAGGRVLVV